MHLPRPLFWQDTPTCDSRLRDTFGYGLFMLLSLCHARGVKQSRMDTEHFWLFSVRQLMERKIMSVLHYRYFYMSFGRLQVLALLLFTSVTVLQPWLVYFRTQVLFLCCKYIIAVLGYESRTIVSNIIIVLQSLLCRHSWLYSILYTSPFLTKSCRLILNWCLTDIYSTHITKS